MKKILLMFSLLAGLTFTAIAQQQDSKYKVSIGGEYLIPAGSTAEYNGNSIGASIQGEYKLLPKLSVTASAGYMQISYSKLFKEIWKPWLGDLSASTFYPVKGGAKYFVLKNVYAMGEAGAAITTEKDRSTSFAYAGGLGTAINFSKKSSIDVSARYETWALSSSSKSTFIGIRAAYAFGF
jgi:hypothetical protein